MNRFHNNAVSTRPLHRRHSKYRRGILILVVISLLFLFVLLAVSFVMVANRHRSTSKSYERLDQAHDTPTKEMDSALGIIARGDLTPGSPFLNRSLLEDMYGHLSLQATISNIDTTTYVGGEIVQLTLNNSSSNNPSWMPPDPNNYFNFLQNPGYYTGCVLTMLEGPAKGSSSRIVAAKPDDSVATPAASITIYVQPFRDSLGNVVSVATGNRVLINGREFSGAGVGYNSYFNSQQGSGGNLDVVYNFKGHTGSNGPLVWPVALLPNLAASFPTSTTTLDSQGNPEVDAIPFGILKPCHIRRLTTLRAARISTVIQAALAA